MIVIPMAGLSRRFREAGYDRPKFMLDLHGKSLFVHAVESFSAYFNSEPFLFIARDEPVTSEFIHREVASLGIGDSRTVLLPHETAGQADTICQGLRKAEVSGQVPLTIFNIDTFRPGFSYPAVPWMGCADGYIEVMKGSDPGFSFVLPDKRGESRVAATAEKEVISHWASTGLYWFRRTDQFLDAVKGASKAKGELYVAPLYNHMIANGCDIRFEIVPAQAVVFCGIPLQYEQLLQQNT